MDLLHFGGRGSCTIKTIIHIGAEKCASSYLQYHVFPCWGVVCRWWHDTDQKLREAKKKDLPLFITAEHLWSRETDKMEQLMDSFPHALLLMGVRPYEEYARAYWVQLTVEGKCFTHYSKWRKNVDLPDPNRFADTMASIHGERFLCFKLDDLKRDSSEVLQRIAKWSELPPLEHVSRKRVNPSVKTAWQLEALRVINRLRLSKLPMNPVARAILRLPARGTPISYE